MATTAYHFFNCFVPFLLLIYPFFFYIYNFLCTRHHQFMRFIYKNNIDAYITQNKVVRSLSNKNVSFTWFFCYIIYLFFFFNKLEVNFLYFYMFTASLVVVFISSILRETFHFNKNYMYITVGGLNFFSYFIFSSVDFLFFLLFLELIGYFFYYQLVSRSETSADSNLKLLSLDTFFLYFWGLFVGAALLVYVVLNLLKHFSSLSFFEVGYLSMVSDFSKNIFFVCVLLFLVILFKSGATGVHFWKSEIYKFIGLLPMFVFTTLSLSLYCFILVFLSCNLPFFHSNFLVLFPYLLFSGLFLLSLSFYNVDSYFLLFGYSASLSVIMLLFLLV